MTETAERFDRIRTADPEALNEDDRALRELWDLLAEIPGAVPGEPVGAYPGKPDGPPPASTMRVSWILAAAAMLAALAIGVGWVGTGDVGLSAVEVPETRTAGAAERVLRLQRLDTSELQIQALRLLREDPNANVRLAALDVLRNQRATKAGPSIPPWTEPLGSILQAEGSPHVQIPLLAFVEPEALRVFLKRPDLDDTAREIAEARLKNRAASEL